MDAALFGSIPEIGSAPDDDRFGDSTGLTWTGPRWWWSGHLDVEGVALGSVMAVARALRSYCDSAGVPLEVGFTSAGIAASFASWTHLTVAGRSVQGFAPLSGFRRAADGWVRLHANYEHHVEALLSTLGARTAEGVAAAISERSAADVEDAVTAAGGVATRVRTPSEWMSGAQASSLLDEPWIRFEHHAATTSVACTRTVSAESPLDGVRILDLTRVITGPSATRLLGALGADVLRIDPPGVPELWDMHVDTGFDKRSALADLSVSGDREKVRELTRRADMVLTGYRGTSLEKFGLDRDSLRVDHPDLPVVSFDAWGDTGPWSHRRGFDSIVQAATGISSIYGTGEGESWVPGALPVQVLDHAVGMGAAAAVLTLLQARSCSTSGFAHLSLARTAHELLSLPAPLGDDEIHQPAAPLRTATGFYGDTTFVPPPLRIGGHQLEYRALPRQFGSDELAWGESFQTVVS